LKERKIDLAMGTWRGLAAPKGIPPDVLAKLNAIALGELVQALRAEFQRLKIV
jgi:tripartite-type tricarboxylate transporter receptor subunit TctC